MSYRERFENLLAEQRKRTLGLTSTQQGGAQFSLADSIIRAAEQRSQNQRRSPSGNTLSNQSAFSSMMSLKNTLEQRRYSREQIVEEETEREEEDSGGGFFGNLRSAASTVADPLGLSSRGLNLAGRGLSAVSDRVDFGDNLRDSARSTLDPTSALLGGQGIGERLARKGGSAAWSGYEDVSDWTTGMGQFLLYDYDDEGNRRFSVNPLGETEPRLIRHLMAQGYSEEEAQEMAGSAGPLDMAKMMRELGRSYSEDDDVSQGMRFGMQMLTDPLMRVPVGSVGMAARGLASRTRLGEAIKPIFTGKANPLGAALEGTHNPNVMAFGAGAGAEAFDRVNIPLVPEEWQPMVGGFVGGGLSSAAARRLRKQGAIDQQSRSAMVEEQEPYWYSSPDPREWELPRELAGAKPRFGYQSKNFELDFEAQVDKALYIVASTAKKSRHDEEYMEFLRGIYRGSDDQEIRRLGARIREDIKLLARGTPDDQIALKVPRRFAPPSKIVDPAEFDKTPIYSHSPDDLMDDFMRKTLGLDENPMIARMKPIKDQHADPLAKASGRQRVKAKKVEKDDIILDKRGRQIEDIVDGVPMTMEDIYKAGFTKPRKRSDREFVFEITNRNQWDVDVSNVKDRLLGRLFAGVGINPSAVMRSFVGKNAITYVATLAKSRDAVNNTMSSAFYSLGGGPLSRKPFGRLGYLFKTDKEHRIKQQGLDSVPVHDLLESYRAAPNKFNNLYAPHLNDVQMQYVRNTWKVLDEINDELALRRLDQFDKFERIPRTVAEINEIQLNYEKTGLKHHLMNRKFDLAADGIANGVNYSDPIEGIRLYMLAAYKEIADYELAQSLMRNPELVTQFKAIDPDIIDNIRIAALRKDHVNEELAKARKAFNAHPEDVATRTWYDDMLKKQQQASKASNEALEKYRLAVDGLTNDARYEHIMPGHLFGRREGSVKAFEWTNKFMREPMPEQWQRHMKPVVPEGFWDKHKLAKNRATSLREKHENLARLSKLNPKDKNLKEKLRQVRRDRLMAQREFKTLNKRAIRFRKQGGLKGSGEIDRTHAYFTEDDYEILRRYVGVHGKAPEYDQVSSIWRKGMRDSGDAVRFLSSSLDIALQSIQFFPMLMANHPTIFGRAVMHQVHALLDPSVMHRYIRDNNKEVAEMISKGGVPIDTELFRAVEEGGIFRRIGARAGGPGKGAMEGAFRQTYGRFQASYTSGLNAARIMMWNGLKDSYRGNEHELGRFIRNMTGGLDSRRLGVSANQRAAESLFLAFSPRLLRSNVGLLAMAAEGDPRAIKTVTVGMLGALTVFAAAGTAMGKDPEEIIAHMNPLEGKKFLAYQINGDWVGIGGQVRAMTQLVANVGRSMANGEWSKFTDLDWYENPLISFYSSRGAVGLSAAGAMFEGLTGVDALPYNEVEGPVDALYHIGTQFMPFTTQNAILSGTGRTGTTAGFFGLRVSPQTWTEKRNELITEMFPEKAEELGRPLTTEDLNMEERRQYNEAHPFEGDATINPISRYFRDIEETNKWADEMIAMAESAVFAGVHDKQWFRERYQDIQQQRYARIDQINETYEDVDAERFDFEGSVVEFLNSRYTQPEDKALQEYYNLRDRAIGPDGLIDFEKLEELREELITSLPREHAEYVIRNTQSPALTSEGGLLDEYEDVKEVVRPYWEAPENVYNTLRDHLPFLQEFGSLDELETWIANQSMAANIQPSVMRNILEREIEDYKKFREVTTRYRRLIRVVDPKLDVYLQEWYGIGAANTLAPLLEAEHGQEGLEYARQIGHRFMDTNSPEYISRRRAGELSLALASQRERTAMPVLQQREFGRTRFSLTK